MQPMQQVFLRVSAPAPYSVCLPAVQQPAKHGGVSEHVTLAACSVSRMSTGLGWVSAGNAAWGPCSNGWHVSQTAGHLLPVHGKLLQGVIQIPSLCHGLWPPGSYMLHGLSECSTAAGVKAHPGLDRYERRCLARESPLQGLCLPAQAQPYRLALLPKSCITGGSDTG